MLILFYSTLFCGFLSSRKNPILLFYRPAFPPWQRRPAYEHPRMPGMFPFYSSCCTARSAPRPARIIAGRRAVSAGNSHSGARPNDPNILTFRKVTSAHVVVLRGGGGVGGAHLPGGHGFSARSVNHGLPSGPAASEAQGIVAPDAGTRPLSSRHEIDVGIKWMGH